MRVPIISNIEHYIYLFIRDNEPQTHSELDESRDYNII